MTNQPENHLSNRQKRNIRLSGKRTTMVLEPYVWQSVDNILEREDIDLDEFCRRVDEARINSSLASATRMIVLTYFKLSDQLNNPPFWNPNDQPSGHNTPPAHFSSPAPAAIKFSALPLAIRRFAQEEVRA
jgi:predicted DNA-binding ribbon-helix-helix protein